MLHSVKVDEDLYQRARSYAKAEHRTISAQVTYWAEIGKIALENPDLPTSFIKDILIAKQTKEEFEPFEFSND